ncbi:non-canonical purine NTP pyrophosphatase [Candidatus Saccharibacteria bacterium]|jgi:non-canonical purine NTP pyrophosphatase (RdgB/HAM1 family)|nr:non-canonical purine NTP pyrophosphatase [Candidatus Saccharibacteria bacterium]
MKTKPLFVTGNAHKAEHMEKLLGIAIDHQKFDFDEIQSKHPEEVIEHKVRQAYGIVKRPVFVDDFSFWFDDLNGLPGPFIKYFIQADDSLEKLCRLADGLSSRRVTARAYCGYYDGTMLKIMYGELKGEITQHPQGDAPYAIGTDFVFAVDGWGGRTRGELTQAEYEDVYGQVRAVDRVQAFFNAQGYE